MTGVDYSERTSVDLMHAAVLDELAAQREEGSHREEPVFDGIRVGGGTTSSVYNFRIDGEVPARDGDPLILIVGESQYDAELLAQRSSQVTLRAEGVQSSKIPEATIRADATFLLKRLAEFLSGEAPRPEGFSSDAAQTIFAESSREPTLRLGQKQAEDLSMRRRVTYLWGPPGTGKTHTVSQCVKHMIDAGLRVLVVSYTNVAVDTVIARCAEELRGSEVFASGQVVRVGEVVRDDLDSEIIEAIQVDDILARRGHQHATQRVDLKSQLTLRLRRLRRIDAAAPERDQLADEIASLSDRLSELDSELDALRHSVVDSARLLACTTHQLYLGRWVTGTYDAVILDEASMVPLPLSWVAAGMSQRHLLIAGDFRQLPPVVQSSERSVLEWYARDAFASSGATGAVSSGEGRSDLTALDLQYRMEPQIAELVSTAFYSPLRLRTADTVFERPGCDLPPLLNHPISLIPTSGEATWCARPGGRNHRSRYNPISAQLVFLANLQLRRDPAAEQGDELVALSPYRAQARLLAAADQDATELSSGNLGAASTVHRFQGNERHTVVIDLTDAQRLSIGPFFRTDPLDTGSRLLNVAASRAQSHLVVVGDLEAIRAEDPPAAIGRMLSGLADTNAVSVDTLVGKTPYETAWTTQGTDPTEILRILETATESVLLCSSGIGSEGLTHLLPALIDAQERGSTVRLVVPATPHNEQVTPEWVHLLDRLEAMHVAVDQRSEVSDDVLTIDGTWLLTSTHPLLVDANDHPAATRRRVIATRSPALVDAISQFLRRRATNGRQLLPDRTVSTCRTCSRPEERVETWVRGEGGRSQLKHWVRCRACAIPPSPRPTESSGLPTDDEVRRALPIVRWPTLGTGAVSGRRTRIEDRSWADLNLATDVLQEFQCVSCFLILPTSQRASSTRDRCLNCA